MRQNFTQLLQALADSGVEFVIVGGYAAVAHGSTLVTRDLGICALLTPQTMAALRRALAPYHPRHRMTPQRLSFLEHPQDASVQNLYLETDVGVVDILTSVLGIGELERLKERAELLRIGGREYRLIALQDLIVAKEAMGREKDLLAAKELRAIAAKRIKLRGNPGS